MIAPTVHINGSSRDDLLAKLETAYRAVNAALEAVQGSAPNARDYYVQGPDAFPRATIEHNARTGRLADIATELLDLYLNVENQP